MPRPETASPAASASSLPHELRGAAYYLGYHPDVSALVTAAADEIERLRSILANVCAERDAWEKPRP